MTAPQMIAHLTDQMRHTLGDATAASLPCYLRNPLVRYLVALSSIFDAVGIHEAEISTEKGSARFPTIRVMVEADLRGWLPVMGVFLTEDQIQLILNEAETALRSYAGADGQVKFEVSAHIVSASRTQ